MGNIYYINTVNTNEVTDASLRGLDTQQFYSKNPWYKITFDLHKLKNQTVETKTEEQIWLRSRLFMSSGSTNQFVT